MALNTREFVSSLADRGYTHLCVVPCSFAKNIINEAINNDAIAYLPAASEAVACSVAAGLKMSGQRPIVIIQSSGLTNMGSCITSLLKPYNITFPIMTSWRDYNEGDSEIQHMHLAKYLPNLVEAYGYRHLILDNNNASEALSQIDRCDKEFSLLVIPKNSFTSVKLKDQHILDVSQYLPRSIFLQYLNERYRGTDKLFIGTTGNTAREMYSFMPGTNNFYMAGNMGGALSLGLGAALGGRATIVCGGDAEFVMHMGGLTTAGRYRANLNLIYILFDNEQNKSTGGQNSYQQHVNYSALARSAGLSVSANIILDIEAFSSVLSNAHGPAFVHVKCSLDDEMPRPPLTVVGVNKF